jgi:hypothetical protein
MTNKPTTPPPDPAKDPRNQGNNGNPAQSAGRVTAREQDENPEPLDSDPNEIPAKDASRIPPADCGVQSDPRTPAGENI